MTLETYLGVFSVSSRFDSRLSNVSSHSIFSESSEDTSDCALWSGLAAFTLQSDAGSRWIGKRFTMMQPLHVVSLFDPGDKEKVIAARHGT